MNGSIFISHERELTPHEKLFISHECGFLSHGKIMPSDESNSTGITIKKTFISINSTLN